MGLSHYKVQGANRLTQACSPDGGRRPGVWDTAAIDGVYRVPWLYEKDVCVGKAARDILEARAWPGTIELRSITVYGVDE